MNWLNYILAALTIVVSSEIGIASAQAPARVGEAAVVQNEVIRVSGSGGTQINVGDAVLRDETVRTGANSATQTVGSTAGMSAGDWIYFATAQVSRLVSSITDATHVVLTAAVTTTTGETVTATRNNDTSSQLKVAAAALTITEA